MKLALLLAATDAGLGGVLLGGEKGTAKSTAARALAALLPPLNQIHDDAQGCAPRGPSCPERQPGEPPPPSPPIPTPFVDLPLGVSEDRLLGALDWQAAIADGLARFRPGLLARAHRGVLYVDEINLLPVHLTAQLLDAVASGVNRVEREGISHAHPCQITLVASMNPEEGPLGPQIMDRFGLWVGVCSETDPQARREILLRRLAFEANPAAFAARWAGEEEELRRRLTGARELLPQVRLSDAALRSAARLACQARCQGQRGELALARAARALAAWQDREEATPEHVLSLAPLALGHRARGQDGHRPAPVPRLRSPRLPEEPPPSPAPPPGEPTSVPASGHAPGAERGLLLLTPDEVRPIATRLPAREGTSRRQAGRRTAREVNGNRGRYLRASAVRLGRSLAFDATLRAAAPHQLARRFPGGPALVLKEPDLREKVRAARRGRLLLFVVDASGSMNAAARMRETKAAVLGLLTEAYQKRDRVGVICFGGVHARELLPPTNSVEVARRMLADLPTGGKTPLAAGLALAAHVLSRELAQDARLEPLVVVLTDGRPNVPLAAARAAGMLDHDAGVKGGGWGDGWGDGGYADREVLNLAQRLALDRRPRYVVVDTDVGHHHEINLCRAMADYLGAACTSLRNVTAQGVLEVVRRNW